MQNGRERWPSMPGPPTDRCADRRTLAVADGANAPPSPSPDWRDLPLSAFPQAASRTPRCRETTRIRLGMSTQLSHGPEDSRSSRPRLAFDPRSANLWRDPKTSWLLPCVFARSRVGSRRAPAWRAPAKISDLLWWLVPANLSLLKHRTRAIWRFQGRKISLLHD